MKRRVVVFIACWFFAAGIVCASFLLKEFRFFGLYYFSAAVLLFILAVWLWKKRNTRAVIILAAFLFLGAWRFSVGLPIDAPDEVWHYNGQKVELVGLVSSEPATKGKSQKLEVQGITVRPLPNLPFARGGVSVPLLSKEGLGEVSGKVLAVAAAYPQYNYGDVLKLTCQLKKPDKLEGFDYEKYLAGKGIYSTCGFPKISVLKDSDLAPEVLAKKKVLSRDAWFWGGVFKIRNILSAAIDNGVSEPEAGLLKAFILNDPTVPDDLSEYFRQSGLSHIVAISGSHISLVIAIIFFCLLFLGLNRRHAFWFCVPLIFFYVAMVGAPASALRAGIMGFFVLLAMYLGRLSRLDHALVLSGAAMLMFNPMLVIADAGFQLSFLAVLGMIYIYPVFNKWLSRLYENKTKTHPLRLRSGRAVRSQFVSKIMKIICQTFALTIAAQVFTAPILIFGFHQISLVAPLANLLVLWAAPLIMIGAFIAMGLSFIFPALAMIFFLPVDILLKYLIFIAEWSGNIPGAYLKW